MGPILIVVLGGWIRGTMETGGHCPTAYPDVGVRWIKDGAVDGSRDAMLQKSMTGFRRVLRRYNEPMILLANSLITL